MEDPLYLSQKMTAIGTIMGIIFEISAVTRLVLRSIQKMER